jgi:sulfopyruvate decarboxylase TPP-binding subunit
MAGKRPAVMMHNRAIGLTISTLVTFLRYYPMLISSRGKPGELVVCQVETSLPAKALLTQINITTDHFHHKPDADKFDPIMTDATFRRGYGE